MATPPNDSPRRLGRGLDALLATKDAITTPQQRQNTAVEAAAKAAEPDTTAAHTPAAIPIELIRPNPFQPRKEFREADLTDLANSLRVSGLLQPVNLRPDPSGVGYQLIAGERRLRAATSLGWTSIPAIVRDVDDRTLLSLAIVENLQRADLNPIEEAEGYERLAREHALSQQQVAELVGKDRSTVANALRLLGLPATVKAMVRDAVLSAGHGRALLTAGVPSRIERLAREAASQGWSVRETERRAKSVPPAPSAGSSSAAPATRTDPNATATTRRIEQLLRQHLQTETTLHLTARDRGEIRIAFVGADDLDRLLHTIGIRLDD